MYRCQKLLLSLVSLCAALCQSELSVTLLNVAPDKYANCSSPSAGSGLFDVSDPENRVYACVWGGPWTPGLTLNMSWKNPAGVEFYHKFVESTSTWNSGYNWWTYSIGEAWESHTEDYGAGEYSVDLFVNGSLADTGTFELETPSTRILAVVVSMTKPTQMSDCDDGGALQSTAEPMEITDTSAKLWICAAIHYRYAGTERSFTWHVPTDDNLQYNHTYSDSSDETWTSTSVYISSLLKRTQKNKGLSNFSVSIQLKNVEFNTRVIKSAMFALDVQCAASDCFKAPANVFSLPFERSDEWLLSSVSHGTNIGSFVNEGGICSMPFEDYFEIKQKVQAFKYHSLDHRPKDSGGIDWGNPQPLQWPVLAALEGNVSFVARCKVTVDHGFGWKTAYGHLDNVYVIEGQRVLKGELLANVANNHSVATCLPNSFAGAPHLHWSISWFGVGAMNGTTIDGWQLSEPRYDYDSNCDFGYAFEAQNASRKVCTNKVIPYLQYVDTGNYDVANDLYAANELYLTIYASDVQLQSDCRRYLPVEALNLTDRGCFIGPEPGVDYTPNACDYAEDDNDNGAQTIEVCISVLFALAPLLLLF